MSKQLRMAITVAIVLSTVMTACNLGSELLVGPLSTDATDSSPLAPDIVTGQTSSESRSLVDPESQNLYPFVMIQASAFNYNSMVNETVPEVFVQLAEPEAEEAAIEIGPFTRRVQNVLSSDGKYGYFDNDDATIVTVISDEGAIRQFDAFVPQEPEMVKYSRSIFYWGSSGMDVTEVWEYADRKAVSVTMYWGPTSPAEKDRFTTHKYLSITDTSDEFRRTSLLYGFCDLSTARYTLDDNRHVGYIDFTMWDAAYADYDQRNTFLPSEYPTITELLDLHAESVDPNDLPDVTVDSDSMEPYVGWF